MNLIDESNGMYIFMGKDNAKLLFIETIAIYAPTSSLYECLFLYTYVLYILKLLDLYWSLK